MTLVCAAHPSLEAIARCVRCGLHLCPTCRTLDGVRNFCRRCSDVPTTTSAAAVVLPTAAAIATPRSPWLAATLSLVPGLGQLYAGRLLRGGIVFAGCTALRHAPWMTPLLFAFTYAFNLFDAYRIAQERSEVAATGPSTLRFDDTLFLLIGIGTAAFTLLENGGFFGAQRETLLPLAGYATALLIAHETRR